jgi:hypothetical protein
VLRFKDSRKPGTERRARQPADCTRADLNKYPSESYSHYIANNSSSDGRTGKARISPARSVAPSEFGDVIRHPELIPKTTLKPPMEQRKRQTSQRMSTHQPERQLTSTDFRTKNRAPRVDPASCEMSLCKRALIHDEDGKHL